MISILTQQELGRKRQNVCLPACAWLCPVQGLRTLRRAQGLVTSLQTEALMAKDILCCQMNAEMPSPLKDEKLLTRVSNPACKPACSLPGAAGAIPGHGAPCGTAAPEAAPQRREKGFPLCCCSLLPLFPPAQCTQG